MSRHKKHHPIDGDYVRSSFFGIEDSLVSTTGLIAGVSAGTTNVNFVILAGLVAIAVEAISMAAGEFLSEETEHDLTKGSRGNPIIGGLIMLVSYFLAGLIPLLPRIFFPPPYAEIASIGFAFVGLFILGLFKGRITGKNPLRAGIEVLTVGGLAAMIGIFVGRALHV